MFGRSIILILSLTQLPACVAIPEIHFTETMSFDFAPPSQVPVNYADLMCCFDCTV